MALIAIYQAGHPGNPEGKVFINDFDFDEKIHVLFNEKTTKSSSEGAGEESSSATAEEAEVKAESATPWSKPSN